MLSLPKHLYRFAKRQSREMETIFNELFKQLMLSSDNGTANIEHPWYPIQEASRCSGKPKQDIIDAFKAFEKYGLIRAIDSEKSIYAMTELSNDFTKVEAVFNILADSKD